MPAFAALLSMSGATSIPSLASVSLAAPLIGFTSASSRHLY
jgi:hypothetical protein